MTFDEWIKVNYTTSHPRELAKLAYEAAQSFGIKTHDGQKLLVQHILDTDGGLSENSRKILEELMK